MTHAVATRVEVAPGELSASLRSVRLCPPEAQERMARSLARLGQLTPVLAYRTASGLEVFDGLKRWQAAQKLPLPTLRVEVHSLDAAGAKVRLLTCNAGAQLTDLEVAWVVRSLHREEKVSQPQIAQMLGRDKSWVCRKLALAEGLTDEVTASLRLGLLSATAAAELSRLQRCNQDEVAQAVTQRGLTTRQTAVLVDALLSVPREQWPRLLAQPAQPLPAAKGRPPRRTPGEQLVADAWALKRLSTRLHARLLERSLPSLGEPACTVVAQELAELRASLAALAKTLDARLPAQVAHAAA
jgi:ParB-like chromosome segregation protein Spo0J